MKSTYYVLTEEDKQAIAYHKKTFEEIDDIGFDILDNVLGSEEKIENYKIPIRSILYRLLELNDTLNIMVQNSLISTAFPILRSEFEIHIQLLYLLKESNLIEEKALLYHYCDIRRMNSKSLEIKKKLDDFLYEHKYLEKIHKKYLNKQSLDKTNWYSLYEGERISFKKLCETVGKQEDYYNIYPHLSADIHGTGTTELNTSFEDDEKYYLLNFRHFERNHTLMIYHIDFFRNVFLAFTDNFDKNEDIKKKAILFYQRAEGYINIYKSMKENMIDPTWRYSI